MESVYSRFQRENLEGRAREEGLSAPLKDRVCIEEAGGTLVEAKQNGLYRYKNPPMVYRITSSAKTRRCEGSVRPSVWAVLDPRH
jgi:hypothetical protein